jgi:hypothetical protein
VLAGGIVLIEGICPDYRTIVILLLLILETVWVALDLYSPRWWPEVSVLTRVLRHLKLRSNYVSLKCRLRCGRVVELLEVRTQTMAGLMASIHRGFNFLLDCGYAVAVVSCTDRPNKAEVMVFVVLIDVSLPRHH